ncbi:CAP domain-containing protein [Paenibacillus sp. MBLB4367]|uniref:CAP domain-containing protein n=1 Tax=Paenibacillus sp. MBLB4367 TaxID=3384767 RepID=UPI0039080934
MKKVIVIAALLVAAGCSSNHITKKQSTPNQTKIVTPSPSPAQPSNLTQASSVSTAGDGKITANQVPIDASNWMEWFKRINEGKNPVDPSLFPQLPVNPQHPVTQPANPQQPATQPANPAQTAKPQQPANPPQSSNSSQYAQQVLDLVNQERSKAGLKPLSMSSGLTKVAMAKAQDMYNNNYFDHQSPTYGSPFDMMKSFGITYNSAGENIAKGQSSPAEVMNQWMNSPGHRANILNSSFTQIGIAYYNSEWVQEFTG